VSTRFGLGSTTSTLNFGEIIRSGISKRLISSMSGPCLLSLHLGVNTIYLIEL
jgi:hypothetical protein